MTSVCSRCNREGETEFGADGQSYCSACSFYSNNKQCWKCRMYVPATELQQYRGQLTCPYCIQDLRDEDRKAERKEKESLIKESYHAEALVYSETCERCGGDFEGTVYIMNRKRLCMRCVKDLQNYDFAEGKPTKGGQRISVRSAQQKKKQTFIEKVISQIVGTFRKDKSEQPRVEIVDIKNRQKVAEDNGTARRNRGNPVPLARPLSEGVLKKLDEPKPVQVEGIMMKKRKITKKTKKSI